MLRTVYGMHAPMRLLMERKIVQPVRLPVFKGMIIANTPRQPPSFPGMPQSSLHLDILMGRDELIEPADVFLGMFLPLSIVYSMGSNTSPFRHGDRPLDRRTQRNGKELSCLVVYNRREIL
jgi:hypothetical protein